jgi:hypothetical protein
VEESPKPAAASAPRRSPLERVVVWGGIILLLAVVYLEWNSKNNYRLSLGKLESAMQQSNKAEDLEGISQEDAQRSISGFAKRGEQTVQGTSQITYTWPSLFKKYQVKLSLDKSGRVTLVETDSDRN